MDFLGFIPGLPRLSVGFEGGSGQVIRVYRRNRSGYPGFIRVLGRILPEFS
jgi:hypothetical protein